MPNEAQFTGRTAPITGTVLVSNGGFSL